MGDVGRGGAAADERALGEAFPGVDLAVLRVGARFLRVAAGEQLCARGDPADVAWVVVSGRLEAVGEQRGGLRVLGHHGPGTLVGEAALLEKGRRAATLRAVRDSRVAVLDREWLATVLASGSRAVHGILGAIVDRHRRDAPGVHDRVVALVPTSTSVSDLALRVAEAMAAGPERVAVRTAEDATAGGSAGDLSWLAELEADHDLVVLVAEPRPSTWTMGVARSADRVATFVDTVQGPERNGFETRLAEWISRVRSDRRVLVLVHPPTTARPRRTGDWLAARDVCLHLHARADRDADVGRVARHLSGRAVGLVLGGGGARALGHLGVLDVLVQRGVPVDLVTGSSAGAIMGAYVAVGMHPQDARLAARRDFDNVKDLTLPVAGLLRGRRTWERLLARFGDWDIADTWIPFACVTTDLTAAATVVHRDGALPDALRASCSIPGVFPPVELQGHVHVDGGLLDNLPVAAAESLDPAARLVVIDVTPPRGPPVATDLPREVSGWHLLGQRLLPGRRPVMPPLIGTLLESTVVGAVRQRADALASDRVALHLHLDLHGFAVLAFEHVERIIDRAAAEAANRVDAWLAGAQPPVPRVPPGARGTAPVTDISHQRRSWRRRVVAAVAAAVLALAAYGLGAVVG